MCRSPITNSIHNLVSGCCGVRLINLTHSSDVTLRPVLVAQFFAMRFSFKTQNELVTETNCGY